MPKVIYRPRKGGKFFAPGLKPGAELTVSAAEAEHLIGTGAFESGEPKPAAPAAPPAPAAKQEPVKGGKETR